MVRLSCYSFLINFPTELSVDVAARENSFLELAALLEAIETELETTEVVWLAAAEESRTYWGSRVVGK
jgi:hypothetical protein